MDCSLQKLDHVFRVPHMCLRKYFRKNCGLISLQKFIWFLRLGVRGALCVWEKLNTSCWIETGLTKHSKLPVTYNQCHLVETVLVQSCISPSPTRQSCTIVVINRIKTSTHSVMLLRIDQPGKRECSNGLWHLLYPLLNRGKEVSGAAPGSKRQVSSQ